MRSETEHLRTTALSARDDEAEASFPSFWKSDVAPTQLDYMLNEEVLSIKGDAYEGFTRIWKALLGGRRQLDDTDVVKTLRSSGMTDEALGGVWQEASQAILLDTSEDDSNDFDENSMEWRDFIVLLDTCYRMSSSDLKIFLERFQLPSPRRVNIKGKKNPFRTPSVSDSAVSSLSPDVTGGSHVSASSSGSQLPFASSHASPDLTQGQAERDVVPEPKSLKAGLDLGRRPRKPVPSPIPPRAPQYLENLQGDSHTDGLKEFTSIHGSPNPAGLGAVSVTNPFEVYDIGRMQSVYRGTGIEVVQAPLEPNAFADHSRTTIDVYAGVEAFEPTRDLLTVRQNDRDSVTRSGGWELSDESVISESTSGSTSPLIRRSVASHLPEIFEVDVPHCTPLARQIAMNRLISIEGDDSLRSNGDGLKVSLKRLSLSRSKTFDQGRAQFSLSNLATGLEGAAKEGSLSIIEAFFALGADPNYSVNGPKPVRHRALELAAIGGHSTVVDYLINRGAHSAAINTALVFAVLAGKVEIATRLIAVHHADVDSGIFLKEDNPEWSLKQQSTALRGNLEHLNVLSAAAKIFDKDERVHFIELLISKRCNINAYIWKVYKFKEYKVGLKSFYEPSLGSVPKSVEDGFGYSALASFTSICPASVKLLLEAGVPAFTAPQKPPPQIFDGFKQRGYSCQTYNIVQPISCITSEAWQLYPIECMQTVEVLAYHGANVSCNEVVDYKEKHAWRRVWNGGFEETDESARRPTNPISRATAGKSGEGIECLTRLGATSDTGLYAGYVGVLGRRSKHK